MTKHTHGLSVTRISGEPIDADFIETSEWEDPAYPACPICEQEAAGTGWCQDCEAYVWDHPVTEPLPPVRGTVRQIMERIEERSLGNGWNRWAA